MPDVFTIVISLSTFAMNVVVLVVAGVWAVGKINVTMATLGTNLDHLSCSIEGLSHTVDRLDGRVDEHATRLTALETIGRGGRHIGGD